MKFDELLMTNRTAPESASDECEELKSVQKCYFSVAIMNRQIEWDGAHYMCILSHFGLVIGLDSVLKKFYIHATARKITKYIQTGCLYFFLNLLIGFRLDICERKTLSNCWFTIIDAKRTRCRRIYWR